jgi:hypothetical protein
MDRKYYLKLLKSQDNIITMINLGYKNGDYNLIRENIVRLNSMTSHVLKMMDVMDIRIKTLESENAYLGDMNSKLIDEKFLNISEDKGVYQKAKRMLDEFYGKQ